MSQESDVKIVFIWIGDEDAKDLLYVKFPGFDDLTMGSHW